MPDTPQLHNIGPAQRRLRRRLGMVALVLASAGALAASTFSLGHLARLALFPLIFGGFLGLLQSKEHT